MYPCILLGLLLFAVLDVIDGAILSRPNNTSRTSVNEAAAVHCTRDRKWTKQYQRQDCVSAVDLFRRHETEIYGESSVLFLAPEQPGHGGILTAGTPRRYIVGGCVMAVLMLNTIEPGLVPAMEPRAYLPMEISSVEDLWFSANEIIRSCMKYGLRFGWREEGLHFNMGVFLWAKDSAIDRHFAQEETAMIAAAETTPNVETS